MTREEVLAVITTPPVIKALRGYEYPSVRPPLVCVDGLRLSVQASDGHYCHPRNNYGWYTEVECGYPSEVIDELLPYAEDRDNPTETIYGHVPVELVADIIMSHGGLA